MSYFHVHSFCNQFYDSVTVNWFFQVNGSIFYKLLRRMVTKDIIISLFAVMSVYLSRGQEFLKIQFKKFNLHELG